MVSLHRVRRLALHVGIVALAAAALGASAGLHRGDAEAHNAGYFGVQCGYASWNDSFGTNHNFRSEFGIPDEMFPEFSYNYHLWAAWITEFDWIEVGPYYCGLQVG